MKRPNETAYARPPENESVANDRQYEEDKEKQKGWYEKAKRIADSFLPAIDPDLAVSVVEAEITLHNGATFTDYALAFRHATNRAIHWTMSVGLSEDYLTNEFESVVRTIYDENNNEAAHSATPADSTAANRQIEYVRKRERPTTPAERASIDNVNVITNLLRRRFGVPDLIAPPNVVHVIPRDQWVWPGTAVYNEVSGMILIQETSKATIFKKKLIHEMLHLKSGNILPRSLNEGLIELTTMNLMAATEDDPSLRAEQEDSRKIMNAYRDELATDGTPLFSADAFVAYVGEDRRLHSETFTYSQERALLETLATKIRARRRNTFKSNSQVLDALMEATLKNDRAMLTRVVDDSLGTGTLQKLSQLDGKLQELTAFVSSV